MNSGQTAQSQAPAPQTFPAGGAQACGIRSRGPRVSTRMKGPAAALRKIHADSTNSESGNLLTVYGVRGGVAPFAPALAL